jgi:hypothetical protein
MEKLMGVWPSREGIQLTPGRLPSGNGTGTYGVNNSSPIELFLCIANEILIDVSNATIGSIAGPSHAGALSFQG